MDYSKYGLPTGSSIDPSTGAVIDSNGNILGHAADFGGTQGQNGEWSAPSAGYSSSGVMLPQGALSSIPNAGLGDFTTGAASLQKQGLVGGSSSLEGVPTVYNDAQGNPQYFYGSPTVNGQSTITDAGNGTWYKNSDLKPIQGLDSQGNPVDVTPTAATYAPSKYDTGALNRSFLGGNAMVLGGMLGSGAIDAAMAGGAGAAGGATAYPVAGGSAIPATELGALPAGAGAAGATGGGISGSQALQMAKLATAVPGLFSALSGSGSGTGSDSPGSAQPNSSGSAQPQYSSNGPWNAPPVATNLTWAPHQQTPASAGADNLAMIYPSLDPGLARQMAQSGMMPSNLGGQQPQPQPYYTYGSVPQITQPVGYAGGGNVHIPEFITGATGHYVKGRGTGQSDEIPAMLANSEYVFDADTVSALGDGSSDAGAKLLDKFRESVRAHKRSAPVDKIPPKASPLQYMKEALHHAGRK